MQWWTDVVVEPAPAEPSYEDWAGPGAPVGVPFVDVEPLGGELWDVEALAPVFQDDCDVKQRCRYRRASGSGKWKEGTYWAVTLLAWWNRRQR